MSETTPMHLETVPLDELHDHPENDYPIREDELQDLLESIRRDGLAQLPLVRSIELDDGREMLQILSGHRRVECFRRLMKEDPEHYSSIPVNVIENCSDEHALILLDISNLMVRQLSPTERAKRFERLWNTVPELRKKMPELKGVRTSQIIAETITRETGQSISRASVDRALAAGRRAQEVEQLVEDNSDRLYKGWLNEFKIREGFSPETVSEISRLSEPAQQELFADYQRREMSPKQLGRHIKKGHEKTDLDVEHSLDNIIRTLETISAWKKKYGVQVDGYRVKYIRNQLTKLTRT